MSENDLSNIKSDIFLYNTSMNIEVVSKSELEYIKSRDIKSNTSMTNFMGSVRSTVFILNKAFIVLSILLTAIIIFLGLYFIKKVIYNDKKLFTITKMIGFNKKYMFFLEFLKVLSTSLIMSCLTILSFKPLTMLLNKCLSNSYKFSISLFSVRAFNILVPVLILNFAYLLIAVVIIKKILKKEVRV